jgi:hypothetical protein
MTSAEHEAPVALVKNDPAVVPWLLANVFGIAVPEFDHASARPGDLQVLAPRTYHADATVLLTAEDQPVYAVVVEVQRARDPDKPYRWKQYLAEVAATVRVTTSLVVHCADPDVARYYRRMVDEDAGSLQLRPSIVTPQSFLWSSTPSWPGDTRAWPCCRCSCIHTIRTSIRPSPAWPRRCKPSARHRSSSTMTSCSPGCRPTPALVGGHS